MAGETGRMGPVEMAARVQARQERYKALQRGTTPQAAAGMAALAREIPNLSPGALYAAGRGGIQPGTPAAQALARGQQKVAAELPLAQAANSGGNPLKSAISWGYKNLRLVVGKTPGVNRLDDALDATGDAIKGVSRGAWIGASAPVQTVTGAVRSAREKDGDFGLEDALSPGNWAAGYKQSDLYAADQEVTANGGYAGLLTGETDVDYGSGFFPGGNVGRRAGEAKMASTDERIGGKLPTIGRYLANDMDLEPGGLAFNVVSGLADLSATIAFDPLSYSKAVTAPLQARKLLSGAPSRGFDAESAASGVDEGLASLRGAPAPTADDIADEMGAVRGIRDTVDNDRALEFLTSSRRGQKLVEVLSKSTDFATMWDATKGKIPPDLLLKLTSKEMTGDEVIEILGPALGKTARTDEKFGVDSIGKASVGLGSLRTAKIKQRKRDVRLFGTLPERVLPKHDVPEQIKNADAFMRNALIKKDDSIVIGDRTVTRSDILRRLAEANGGEGMLEVATDMMALGAKKAIEDFGIEPTRAYKMFQMYGNATSEARKYWVQRVVNEGEATYANRAFNVTDEFRVGQDGATDIRALPHLASQFLDSSIPLPDPRTIREGMSRYARLLGNKQDAGKAQNAWNKAVKIPEMAMRRITDDIFKPLVLLRPAYIVRNQIDEQFRPAAAGLDSLFSHPISYLQWMLTDQKGAGRVLARAGRLPSRGSTDVNGVEFDEIGAAVRQAEETLANAKRSGDAAKVEEARAALKTARGKVQTITPYTDGVTEYARAVTGGVGNFRNRSVAQTNDTILYAKTDNEYGRALGETLHLLHHDPIAMRIARGDDLDELKAAWWSGPLQKYRKSLAQQGERMSYLDDEIGAAQYIDSTVQYVQDAIGDSPVLREAAHLGRIGGVPLTEGDTIKISQKAIAQLDGLKTDPTFRGPEKVLGSRLLRGLQDEESGYRKAVNQMFYLLNDVPVRKLSKSPVFRQRYYQRMEELVSFMDGPAADEVIAGARAANLKSAQIKRMQAKRGTSGRNMTLLEADTVAKADALEYTEELFYSLHHRGQFFDVLSLIFPFGEVFLDSAKKYASLTAQNPVLPYRVTQVVNAGREADINGDGKGFFYTDEQTGEEMFSFPFSDRFLGLVGQEGAGQLRAPVQNLNIMGTSVIPGVGPVVQILAGLILPDEPEFNGIQELISPYGARTLEGGALESFLPSWFTKFQVAVGPESLRTPKQQKAFANATKDWMGYLQSTGEYNLQDVADQQRLVSDAKMKARATFFIRSMAQAFAPSPPSPEFVAYDKDGRLLTQFFLAKRMREIEKEAEEDGVPEAAMRRYIEEFGEQAVLAVIPNTKAAEGRSPIPPNREALEFYQRNKDAAERFPTVFGLFAPDPEGAEFDFVAYGRQLSSGERVVISPDEAIARANQNVARMIYNQATEMAEAASPLNEQGLPKVSKENRELLSELKSQLSEDYPGYSASFENDIPGAIEDLKRAAVDPKLSKTPAGEALTLWLQARDMADQAEPSWRQSQGADDVRDALRALGDDLSAQYPGFSNIYERVLEREMARDY